MATTSNTILSLALFLLLAATTTLPRSNADLALLKKTCQGAQEKFDFCMSTLQSVPFSINATTDIELVHIVFDVSIAYTTGLQHDIYKLADQTREPKRKDNLQYCGDLYGTFISDLSDALEDISKKNYQGASDILSHETVLPDNCERNFDQNDPSPITDRNQRANDYLYLCWRLADYLNTYY